MLDSSAMLFIFDLYDEDCDGVLRVDEIANVTSQILKVAVALGRRESAAASFIEGIMAGLDCDRDGSLSREEWMTRGLRIPALVQMLNPTPETVQTAPAAASAAWHAPEHEVEEE
eukprot:c10409_g2_i1.p1 GENE.c10409_g2_i1~~c10409_g2_i1.p1  ORF type:complete len:125 (-),score=17.96 c10409_g2_i1:122-466(-)